MKYLSAIKNLFLVSIPLLLLMVQAHGEEPSKERMVGGHFIPKLAMGPIAYLELNLAGGPARCSGALVGTRAVLTAAHCVVEAQSAEVYVGGAWHSAVSASVHPDYDPSLSPEDAVPNDLSVIELQSDVTGADPLPVFAHGEVPDGSTIAYFGFGRNEGTEDLRERNGKAGAGQLEKASNGVLLITSDAANAIACAGDSGGPGVYFVDDFSTVVGIMSISTATSYANGTCGFVSDAAFGLVNLQSKSSQKFLRAVGGVTFLSAKRVYVRSAARDLSVLLKKIGKSKVKSLRAAVNGLTKYSEGKVRLLLRGIERDLSAAEKALTISKFRAQLLAARKKATKIVSLGVYF